MEESLKPEILPPLNEDDKMLAALGYLLWFIVPPVILFSEKKKEPFLHFHSVQALIFGGGITVIFGIILLIFVGISRLFASGGSLVMGTVFVISFLILSLIFVILAGLFIYYSYKCLQGEVFLIPFAGEITRRTTQY